MYVGSQRFSRDLNPFRFVGEEEGFEARKSLRGLLVNGNVLAVHDDNPLLQEHWNETPMPRKQILGYHIGCPLEVSGSTRFLRINARQVFHYSFLSHFSI